MTTELLIKPVKTTLLVVVLMFALLECEQAVEIPETEAAFVFPEAVTIRNFELNHNDQQRYDIDSTKGKWSLFFFGYTRCPDVCPTELFMRAEMMRKIEEDTSLLDQPPQVVFVSLDPQQDSPESLQQYAGFYHPSFIGVTGKQSAIDRLSKSMGVYYERVYHLNGKVLIFDPQDGVPAGLENSYLINHSASIFLVNPDGKMHAVFTAPHEPDVMIRDLAAIQGAWL